MKDHTMTIYELEAKLSAIDSSPIGDSDFL
jgi:hypothetical protein